MRILVLGGSGFIGSHVVDDLLVSGHEVRIYSQAAENRRLLIPEVKYYAGDFANTLLLAEAMQGVDAVVHLISTSVPSTSNADPIRDIQSNLQNSVRLFQLMRAENVKRIIFFSSGGTVYGKPSILPIPESHPLNPICSYGIVKVAIEKYMGMFEELYGLQPLIIRASNPYGPRQGHEGAQGVISTFLHRVLSGEKIMIWGDGSVKRDYIYISDLARFCGLAIKSNESGVFNVGSGKGKTLNELVHSLENVTGKKAMVEYKPSRRFDVPEVVLAIDNAKNTFNWQPEVSFEEGLLFHNEWMSKHMKLNPV
jgi:UDP-glucose 4-epimerase